MKEETTLQKLLYTTTVKIQSIRNDEKINHLLMEKEYSWRRELSWFSFKGIDIHREGHPNFY